MEVIALFPFSIQLSAYDISILVLLFYNAILFFRLFQTNIYQNQIFDMRQISPAHIIHLRMKLK